MNAEEQREANRAKQARRRAELLQAARLNGFDKWSTLATFVKKEAKEGRRVVDR